MKNSKRILEVKITRDVDESPDTSWLGDYSNKAETEFAIDREHSLDCVVNNPEKGRPDLSHDEDCAYRNKGECDCEKDSRCDCDGHGDRRHNEFQYFNGPVDNYKGLPTDEIRKYIRQDYERMEGLNNQNWCFLGITARAEIGIPQRDGGHLVQRLTSGGLWGIESDSDESDLKGVENDQLSELRDVLKQFGFSTRAISKAFKDMKRA